MKAAIALGLLGLLTGAAAAEPVALPSSKAILDVPKAWTRLPDDPALVAAFSSGGSVLVISRAQVGNLPAWIKASRNAYLDEIERGALATVPGTKKLARAFAEINKVPTFDLELRRPDGTQLVIRILLFRSYTLAATFEIPKGGALDEARGIAKRFTAPN